VYFDQCLESQHSRNRTSHIGRKKDGTRHRLEISRMQPRQPRRCRSLISDAVELTAVTTKLKGRRFRKSSQRQVLLRLVADSIFNIV
jgi:hypothetical protein